MRQKLKKVGVSTNVPTVYSTERQNQVSILPLQEEAKDDPKEFATLPSFRVRILPVLGNFHLYSFFCYLLGTLPSIFGAAMATYVLCDLADFPMKPLSHQQFDKMYGRILKTLASYEHDVYKSDEQFKLTKRDVAYIVDTVWAGVSAFSSSKEPLVLVRWKKTKPSQMDNLIPLTPEEANLHLSINDKQLHELYGSRFIAAVESKLAQVKKPE